MARSTRSGLALIIVAGVLGLMAALAMAFVTMAQFERRASRQRLSATKAYLLARSGLEDAMARLGAGQDSDAVSTRYQGEDWDGSGGILDGYEASQEVYRAGTANRDDCPVRHALRPSFFVKEGTGSPGRIPVAGRDRGYSGRISGDVYALKVTTEGGFYVNGGDPSFNSNPTLTSDYNTNLRRMLGILAEAVDRDPIAGVPGADDGVPVDQVDGFNLIDSRPQTSRGWESWDQVRDGALGGSQAKLDALRPYLALHARVDRKVIRPNAVGGMENQPYQSWADIKTARPVNPVDPLSSAPDFERINGRIVGRAPVDLAWARTRRPVLIALMAGIKGLCLNQSTASAMRACWWDDDIAEQLFSDLPDAIGTLRTAEVVLDWTAVSDACRQTADQILAFNGELKTWEQWNVFCDSLIVDTALEAESAAALAARDAALAARDAALAAAAPALAARTAAYAAYYVTLQDRNAAGAAYRNNPNATTLAAYNAAQTASYAAEAAYYTACSAPIISPYGAAEAAYSAAEAAYNAALAARNATQPGRSLLKANFNPNSDLNKFGPNASLWRSVDKSDLLVYSTEFSLLPAASPQELECVGRVLGRNGRVLASRVLRAELAPAGILTLTTQKEFVCDDLGDPSVPGDEVSPRLPGAFPFISQSAGAGSKTWGHAVDGLGNVGASLQTYPEPCVDTRPYPQSPPAVLSIRPADYDGSVQLATMETPDNGFYTADSGTPTADMKLLARYTAGLDLDVADAASPPFNNPAARFNQPDTQQVTYNGAGSPNLPELGNGLLDAAKPNTLYPDGCYSEKDRAPSYLDKDNANGFHGVISFWIKSNHIPFAEGVGRGRPFFKWTNFSEGVPGSTDQFFYLGTAPSRGSGVACSFEVGHSPDDNGKEHLFQRVRDLTPHMWALVTMYYDLRSPDLDDCGELLVDAGILDVDKGSTDTYFRDGNDPISASDITMNHLLSDGNLGPHRLVLGKGRPEIEYFEVATSTGSGSDATFDELAIYDFGGAGPDGIPTASAETKASPGILASARFKEGRYYKESAYTNLASAGTNRAAEYFSPPISLGPCRIRALAWTQILPRGLKAPFTGGQVGVDGDPAEGPVNPGDGDPGDGRIVLELADSSGTGYLQDASGNSINTLFTRSALERVDRAVAAPFRLHAVFQPNLKDRENTPILDPLALDDVTVVYEPLGGRRILAWSGEE